MFERLLKLERWKSKMEAREIEVFRIRARVYNSTDFTHNSSGNWLSITFDSERFDTDSMHSQSVNTERLTANTSGLYLITGSVRWVANNVGTRALRFMVDGTTSIAQLRHPNLGNVDAIMMTFSTLYVLTAPSYVTLDAWQDSGGSLAISASANFSPEFAMARIA